MADTRILEVLDKVTSNMEQNIRLISGVEQEVKSLTSILEVIHSMLTDAERWQPNQSTVLRESLCLLRSVACDFDDFLDEWSYTMTKPKVWPSILLYPSYCFPCVVPYHPAAVKLSNLRERLDQIKLHQFQSSRTTDDDKVRRNIATTYIDISGVARRDFEKLKLLNLLLEESSEQPKLHLVSVVGVGELWKTILAKQVYNDEMVKTHFDERIWVSISEPFDKMRVVKAILESLTGHAPNLDELRSIQVEIKQYIKGKKFLLVLDDVLTEGLEEWIDLRGCLKYGYPGSKILVTTRYKMVSECMDCISIDINKDGLFPDEECWKLFAEIAFNGRSSEERQSLETIGIENVARCQGSSRAVKTIASLLNLKKTRPEWENIFCSELWGQNLLGPLWPTYYDLPLSLRQCFLYCAIFPKGCRMSKDELISLWMAHGFLKPTENRDMDMVGNECFHNLGMRSLLQEFEVEEKWNRMDKTYCKMDETVRDFAQIVMKKEYLCIGENSTEEIRNILLAEQIGACLYHLHAKFESEFDFLYPLSTFTFRRLRSLIVMPLKDSSLVGEALPKIFDELTSLRSLSLSQCHLKSIPSSIDKLIHLRWLKLSKNYALKELPETMCKLYNLQTLSLNWCDGLIKFPKGVEKLTNLRHLKNEHTYFLLPKGIRKLSGLRKLPRITVDPKIKDTFRLRDLKNLKDIRGPLTIFFMERQLHTLVEDAKKAQFEEMKHITALSLNFPERTEEKWMQQEDEELVEALRPSPCLEMLKITSYMGANCSSWIDTLTSLKKLKLWYWSNCERLPALAKLPCLEYVDFNHFGRVKKVAAEFYRVDGVMEASTSTAPLFPKLKSLQFMNMMEWEDWNDYEGDEEVMPSQTYLSTENCPNLKALPSFISQKATLQKQIS